MKPGHYVVIGPPGTGKTHWLKTQVEACAERGERVTVCSLTRAAAREVASRVDLDRSRVGTLHSLAHRTMPGGRDVFEKHLGAWNTAFPHWRISGDGTDGRQGPGDKLLASYDVVRHAMRHADAWPPAIAPFVREYTAFKRDTDCVDFTDMLEWALRYAPSPPADSDVLLTDEAQDHSALEFALLAKWARDRVLVTVGDPWQSLYVWRGADPSLLSPAHVPADRLRILSQSYRVPQNVHAVAMRWVRRYLGTFDAAIEYKPTDAPGVVVPQRGTWKTPEPIIDDAEAVTAAGRTAMILTSCNYMLDPLLRELRRRGVPFANPWATRAGHLNPLTASRGVSMFDRVRLLMGRGPLTVHQFFLLVSQMKKAGVVSRGAASEIEEYAKRQPETPAIMFADQWAMDPMTVRIVRARESVSGDDRLNWFAPRLLSAAVKRAEFPLRVARNNPHLLANARPRLFVGTIHSVKGGEADEVFLVPDLSQEQVLSWEWGGAARDAIVRQFYVGITRARCTLRLVGGASRASLSMPRS